MLHRLKSTLLFLMISGIIYAQHGIGTNNPNPRSALEISSPDKGILIPRIALQSSSTLNPILGQPDTTLESLLVYNTNTSTQTNGIDNGLRGKGYYYWTFDADNVGSWKRIVHKNIYSADGTMTSTRTVNTDGKALNFVGGGNIGIGTTTPSVTLDVKGGGFMHSLLISSTLTAVPTSTQTNTPTIDLWASDPDSPSKYWFLAKQSDGKTDRNLKTEFSIRDNGRVGIGTLSPKALLDLSNVSNSGVLLPRTALSSQTTFGLDGVDPDEALGLLVFNTSNTKEKGLKGSGFYYWNQQKKWTQMGGGGGSVIDSDKDTHITVEKENGDDEDKIRFTAHDKERMVVGINGTTMYNLLVAASEVASPTTAPQQEEKPAWEVDNSNTFWYLRYRADGTSTRNSGTQFVVDNNGHLGIGITNPAKMLDVNGDVRFRNLNNQTNHTLFTKVLVANADGDVESIYHTDLPNFYNKDGKLSGKRTVDLNTNNLGFNSGKVGINTTPDNINTDATLDVSGNVYANGIKLNSDRRYKTDIQNLKNALEIVMQLRGVKHRWKSRTVNGRKFDSKSTTLGLIAQEVEPYLPELVTTDQNGYKAVDYVKLTVLLIEAVKTQQSQMEQQEERLKRIEKKLGL